MNEVDVWKSSKEIISNGLQIYDHNIDLKVKGFKNLKI